jgi:DNA-binding transcriptional LysR family regulator
MSREYFVKPIMDVQMLALAHKDHPLHALKRQVTRTDMMQHRLVIIEGLGSDISKRQPRNPAQRVLPACTIEAGIQAVQSGLCFGWLPVYRIQHDLDSGELVSLRMPVGGSRLVRLNLVCKDSNPGARETIALCRLLGMNRDMEVI